MSLPVVLTVESPAARLAPLVWAQVDRARRGLQGIWMLRALVSFEIRVERKRRLARIATVALLVFARNVAATTKTCQTFHFSEREGTKDK